jgi:hypothetical protein
LVKNRKPPDTGPAAPKQAVVKVGQIWHEGDPRGGRTVTVLAVAAGDTQAITVRSSGKYAQTYTANRHHFGSPNGYHLVKDVP